jgi:glycosyltransferase involved in cell wall biosynthesis
MTVYNGAEYLRETVESVLNQTYADFTFLIVDNASTDGSKDIIKSYDDERIELAPLPENIGQIAALNKGLERIEGGLVARLDADDICMPRRLEEQAAFMETHPETGFCGTYTAAFKGSKTTRWAYPTDSAGIKVNLLFECAMVHPSVVIRKEVLDQYRLRYDETMNHSFDWDLWQRMAQHTEAANIPKYLVRYRLHEKSESQRTLDLQEAAAKRLDDRTLGQLGLADHPLRRVHRDASLITFNAANRGLEFLEQVIEWFKLLEESNKKHKIYHELTLHRFLKKRLFVVLTHNASLGKAARKIFFKEHLHRYIPLPWTLKFIMKSLRVLRALRGNKSFEHRTG